MKAPSGDAVVIVIGEGPHSEGYGEWDSIELPEARQETIQSVDEATTLTVTESGSVREGITPPGRPDPSRSGGPGRGRGRGGGRGTRRGRGRPFGLFDRIAGRDS